MGLGHSEHFALLISCFLQECERQFSFLTCPNHSPDAHIVSGLSYLQNGRQVISPFTGYREDENAPFWAVYRIERATSALEICFGGEDMVIECYLNEYRSQRYYLHDIWSAAQKDPKALKTRRLIATKKMLQDAVNDIASTIVKDIALVTIPQRTLLERADKIRNAYLEHQIRVEHKRQIESASLKAARAFIKKDYKAVIYWLRPFKKWLDETDLTKLQIAHQRFLEFV